MRLVPVSLMLALACALAAAAPALAQDAPPVMQDAAPKTVADYRAEAKRRAEEAKARAKKQADEEDRMAQEASDADNRRWEEMRALNAERIRQFDEAVEDWVETAPKPPGTAESFIHLTYDNDTALGEGGEVVFFNRHNVPTHRVTFGADGKPTSEITLTQQGKVWETIGPQLADGANTWTASYARDPDGNEIITKAQVVRNSRVIAEYHFNQDGLPWMGERFDASETRIGGFYDPKFEPPPVTTGGPLTVPASFRLVTGVCPQCREKAARYNDLVNQANGILNQMRDQSKEHQSALPPAQGAIKARHQHLAGELAALTPQIEAARAAMLECEKICRPQTGSPEPAVAAGPPTPKLPAPDLTRPSLLPVAKLEIPASFCDEFERVAYMNEVHGPNARASLANVQTANAHVGKLNGLFTEYMRGEGGPGWAAIREEQAAYGPIAQAALDQSNAINALYPQILAVPIVPCPGKTRTAAGDPPPADLPDAPAKPATPLGDQPAVLPARTATGKKPCPPKPGRKPIVVGPNNKVGSGAQLQKKLGGMLVGGLLGAAGVGGGGGGGGGPQLYKCRIKDGEMTVFTHPSGLALKVGAKRGKGDTVNIFADIAKSPDKGTFQAAFLEKPDGGQVQAPSDAGPCDLWGEWELTVSWTKTTYVDGQVVSQESGGWSEGGLFSIPGTLSKVDAPSGMWKQMGFSSASHGARRAFMTFAVPPGGGPLTFVVHITQPKGDPVTTVPFVMTMAETAPGVFTFTEGEAEKDCPPAPVGSTVVAEAPAIPPASPPAPSPPAAPPPTYQPQRKPGPGEWVREFETLEEGRSFVDNTRLAEVGRRNAFREACERGDRAAAEQARGEVLDNLKARLSVIETAAVSGPDAEATRVMLQEERLEILEAIAAAETMACPGAASAPAGDPASPEDVLDDIGPQGVQTNPAFSTGTGASAPPKTPPPPPRYEPTTRAGGERWSPELPDRYRRLKGSKVDNLRKLEDLFETLHRTDDESANQLEEARKRCGAALPDRPETSWWNLRDRWRERLLLRLGLIDTSVVEGPESEQIRARLDAERISVKEMLDAVDALEEPRCPRPALPPGADEPAESILDSIEEVFVPA
ncbi:MAG TPA: hypothetical protein VEA44_04720 [Caulobacter sp.]|nr:hypothetical protein [Caulobacter sp.]